MIPLARLALYVATAGGVVTAVATALGRLETTRYVLVAIVLYVALLLLGLYRPALQMFADAIVRASGSVAFLIELTDESKGREEWLRLVERHNATITVLVTAKIAENSQAFLKILLERGHEIGALGPATMRKWPGKLLLNELEAEQPMWSELQQDSALYWLPSVFYTDRLARIAQAFERELVVCTHDFSDERSPERLLAKSSTVLRATRAGGIVRFRDGEVFRASIAGILDVATQVKVNVGSL